MLRRDKKCGCSSSGRAPPCQGGGSEFEPRQPLQTHHQGNTFPCGNRQIRYRNLFLIEVRGPRKSLLLWGVIASSSLVSRSNQTLRICAVISAAVAHLVERHLAKVEVASSSLVSRSKKKNLSMTGFSFWNPGDFYYFWTAEPPKSSRGHSAAARSRSRRFDVSIPYLDSDQGGKSLQNQGACIQGCTPLLFFFAHSGRATSL